MRQTHTAKLFANAMVLMLAALIFQLTAFAQTDAWARVQLVQPGKKIYVRMVTGSAVTGIMAGWSENAVTVRRGKDKVVVIQKSNVAQVAMVSGMSRGRKALITGLITAGAVGGLVAAACRSQNCCGSSTGTTCSNGQLAGSVLVWALIGSGVAALFPQHHEVIFRAAPAAAKAGSTTAEAGRT